MISIGTSRPLPQIDWSACTRLLCNVATNIIGQISSLYLRLIIIRASTDGQWVDSYRKYRNWFPQSYLGTVIGVISLPSTSESVSIASAKFCLNSEVQLPVLTFRCILNQRFHFFHAVKHTNIAFAVYNRFGNIYT